MGLIKAKSDGLDLSSHTHSVMNTAYMINDMGGYKLNKDVLKYASIIHDLGKANPLFQKNMENNNFDVVCRHEISSLLFINAVPKRFRERVALIVLSHHKSLIDDERSIYKMWNERPEELYKNHIGNIEQWGAEVKQFLLDYFNIKIKVPTYDECVSIIDYYVEKINNLKNGWSEYRGAFMMADHMASCFTNDTERINIILDLFKPVNTDFYNNRDKRYPLSLIDSDNSKKHTFLVAPTGCGKTNFVLKRCKNRIFYTLPYQASINAMYKRIKNDIGENYRIGLKHSSMSSLLFLDEKTKELSSLFGLSITVLTPFQLMSAIIETKGYETILMDLKGQDIILDEIHTYDGVGLTAVISLVKLLVSLDCNIHICTATIPTKFANEIIKILGENNTQVVKLDDQLLKTFDRHIVHTIENINYDDIISRFNIGEKVLVVKNLVSSAQETYTEIKKRLPLNSKILLLHSRFERKRKADIEELLMKLNSSKEPCIVVSTQVVEVSLDINFDVLFTDCADIMSLIQRFGRINRQRTNIGVLKDIFIAKWKNYPNAKNPIYPDEICERTYNELKKYNNKVFAELTIQSVIDNVHNEDFQLVKAERFSPIKSNGEWKTKLYCHNVNNKLANALDIVGYVGILSSKKELYLKNNDKGLEIPIIGTVNDFDKTLRIGKRFLSPYKINDENERVLFYIIPDGMYSDEFGLMQK